jgi:uncharacterized repeat protein (TIGR04052 family)
MKLFPRLLGVALCVAISLFVFAQVSAHTGGPHLRVAHLAPDAPAVDIYLNGDLAFEGLLYRDVTDYQSVDGYTFEVIVVPAGGALEDAVTDTPTTFTFEEGDGGYYTIAAVGSVEGGTFELILLPHDGPQEEHATSAGEHSGEATVEPTAEATLGAASDSGTLTTIRFAATVGGDVVACGTTYTDLGSSNSEVTITDFRFYVSEVHLIAADGTAVPFELEQDGLWQYANVALLDFEDGTAGCSEAGTKELRDVVTGSAPARDYTGIQFTLGLPFELNHIDPTAAPSPLNLTAMAWGWQYGYKFIRIDMLTQGESTDSYLLHLGSTGCVSDAFTSPPQTECTNPNRVSIRLDNFDPNANVIVADLATLLDGVNLGESVPEPPGCMSGTDDPDCVPLFPNLGLSLESGLCADGTCSAQKFFRVE